MAARLLVEGNYLGFFVMLMLSLALIACDDNRRIPSVGENSMPTTASFEKDGEMINEYVVSNSVLQISRKYGVLYSGPGNLNLIVHWPGLIASIDANELELTDRINIIFQPRARYPESDDQEQVHQRYINRTGLLGPEWDEEIGLFVYRDEKSRVRFMKSDDYPTAVGGIYAITCGDASNRTESDQECRAIYPLTDDLRIEYRFFSKHVPVWREIDTNVRLFALSLIRRN